MPRPHLPITFAHVAALVLTAGMSNVAHGQSATAPVPTLLISRQLADARGLSIGDTIRLTADPTGGGTKAREFRVAGIYEPTPDPARINAAKHEARLHLPDLLSLTAAADDVLAGENVDDVITDATVTAD